MSEAPDFQNPETFFVPDDTEEVWCDGGGGALGHPKVWYTFDRQDAVECGYCDRRFVKERARAAAGRQQRFS